MMRAMIYEEELALVCPVPESAHSYSHLYEKITPTLMESSRKSQSHKPKPDLKLNARFSLRALWQALWPPLQKLKK